MKRFFILGLFAAWLFVPLIVLAQAASLPSVDVGSATSGALTAFESKQWALLSAFGVMVIVWAVGKCNLLTKLPSKAVPWVAIALSAIVATASAIIQHQAVVAAVTAGIDTALAGVGAWEAVGQHLLSGPTTAAKVSCKASPAAL